MSTASWMYCLRVGRSFLPVADHQVPQEAMPGLTQETWRGGWEWRG